VALIVGLVVGAGVFKTPALVAAHAGNTRAALLAWVLGGGVSLIGALCYAELATAYPHAGGDYHYLRRAFGQRLSFLFAWARLSVIQTGSLALLAFVFGDYATQLLPLGGYSSPLYAALAVIVLTGLNMAGVRQGTRTQAWLTVVEVMGVLLIIVTGLASAAPPMPEAAHASSQPATGSFGLAMVFVLLTYGGWNEAVYVSAELRDVRRNMARVLIVSLLLVTGLYILVNWAYLRTLGLTGMAQSDAVAADVMGRVYGAQGILTVSLCIAVSALTSANATVFTGARTLYAAGQDFPPFAFLGRWDRRAGTPVSALVVQGTFALLLVLLGMLTRKGFETIVEYTAPVFWLFFLLTGVALFVLRRKDREIVRPFRVPFYPLTPLLFCLTSAYLLYASLGYTGIGAFVGVAVLATGALLLWCTGTATRSAHPSQKGER
jgi:amino acid transporter